MALGSEIWRDYVVDGSPPSGVHPPNKADIRAWALWVEGLSGVRWNFEASTTMASPATGGLRLNHATPASVTGIAVNALSADSGNPSVRTLVASWDDAGASVNRGYLTLKKIGASEVFAVYKVTGSVTDNTTWLQLVVAYVAGSGGFAANDGISATFSASGAVGPEGSMPVGQCRLAKVGNDLVLSPYKGNRLTINSIPETIPDAGMILAPGVGSPTVNYYVYAWMDAGVMKLMISTALPTKQAGTGVSIATGFPTHTLVGFARPLGGGSWIDTPAQRFVRSWFNDPGISLHNFYTANHIRGVDSYDEPTGGSEIRIEYLAWAGEIFQFSANGSVLITATNQVALTAIGIDGNVPEDTWSEAQGHANNSGESFSVIFNKAMTEGHHYTTLLGRAPSGNQTWRGSSTPSTASGRATLHGYTKGAP